jgi:hypothetical protein
LVLSVPWVEGRYRWRWLLTDGVSGNPLADFEVSVPTGDFEYGGFAGLYWWLRWNAAPDRRMASETELLTALLIGIIASLILAGRPNWGGDAFFAMVAAIPVLTPGLIRVGKRGWRALCLSIAVFRRGRGELVRDRK